MHRRNFLRLLGSSAAAGMLPASIARALTLPGNHRNGTIEDVEHIVILMQENRSFDHYFGALRGVRGFGDPRAVNLPTGKTVWHQPNGSGEVLPFHPEVDQLGSQFLQDLAHDWTSTHAAWHGGKYDQWVLSKGTTSMAYLTREDIPFHYALADAFTVCDAYHCSMLSSTDPNRYYMWTGWAGNDGSGGGPVLDNAEAGYGWKTYPETLEKAGVSWKIYQDVGTGLDAAGHWGWTDNAYIGNYGDNSLLYFNQYRHAQPGEPLYDKARTGTRIADGGGLFDQLVGDVRNDRLPQVSWIVAPEAYSEHPNWPANYGAWYIAQVIDALTSNPEVWSKTALLIMYDENDGFFDHVIPPVAPPSHAQGRSTVDTSSEIFPGNSAFPIGPYGLGPRVPMLVVSPWSKGGWGCSEVFDHTSIIRFIERRFGKQYPGLHHHPVSAWRRAVCGDLTSAFDFLKPDTTVVTLPDTRSYGSPDQKRHPDYIPAPPKRATLPTQEPGLRPTRPLPYVLQATATIDRSNTLHIEFINSGKVGVCFHVRCADAALGPWSYTVEAGKSLSGSWPVPDGHDFSVYGPNGFLRRFKGNVHTRTGLADLRIHASYADGDITLTLINDSAIHHPVQVEDAYGGPPFSCRLAPGKQAQQQWHLQKNFGWYELLVRTDVDREFLYQLAGHVETPQSGMSDPALSPRSGAV